jgi:hypothetical protein
MNEMSALQAQARKGQGNDTLQFVASPHEHVKNVFASAKQASPTLLYSAVHSEILMQLRAWMQEDGTTV